MRPTVIEIARAPRKPDGRANENTEDPAGQVDDAG
jgi:hypothetical protein